METTATPPPPSPLPTGDKILAILCHVSPFLSVPFILPFIVYLVRRGESEWVAAHGKETLNFHISLLIYCICTIPLIFFIIGIPIYIALGLMGFICAIVGAIKAAEGGFYFYPLTIRFIR